MDYIFKGIMVLVVVLIASLALNIILLLKVFHLRNTLLNWQDALFDEQTPQSEISRHGSSNKIIYM